MTAIGEVDEANCAIGVAIAALDPGELAERLRRIQNEMFDLGADLATPFGTDFEQLGVGIHAHPDAIAQLAVDGHVGCRLGQRVLGVLSAEHAL